MLHYDTSEKAQAQARIYWPGQVPPFMELRGIVSHNYRLGALIYFKQTGIYAMGNAGKVTAIPEICPQVNDTGARTCLL